MGRFGFCVVIGRPFSTTFLEWARAVAQDDSVRWNSPEFLHATLVNCTIPRGRSLDAEQEALASRGVLRDKMLAQLGPLLRGFEPFELRFRGCVRSGDSLIVPSQADPTIGRLKKALQGDREYWEGDVGFAIPDDVIGVDKYSTTCRRLADSVSVTLGDFAANVRPEKTIAGVPCEPVSSVRVVYYRDRQLRDAIVSDALGLGADDSETSGRIARFFATLEAQTP